MPPRRSFFAGMPDLTTVFTRRSSRICLGLINVGDCDTSFNYQTFTGNYLLSGTATAVTYAGSGLYTAGSRTTGVDLTTALTQSCTDQKNSCTGSVLTVLSRSSCTSQYNDCITAATKEVAAVSAS